MYQDDGPDPGWELFVTYGGLFWALGWTFLYPFHNHSMKSPALHVGVFHRASCFICCCSGSSVDGVDSTGGKMGLKVKQDEELFGSTDSDGTVQR